MAIRSRVRAILELESPNAFCDDCLAPRVGATNRRYVNRITSNLSVFPEFVKSIGICKDCLKSTKLVTRFAASPVKPFTQIPLPGLEANPFHLNTREGLEHWFTDKNERDALVIVSRIVMRFMWYPPTVASRNEKLCILLYRILTWSALHILTKGKVKLPLSKLIELRSEIIKQDDTIARICDLALMNLFRRNNNPKVIVDDIIDVSVISDRLRQASGGRSDVLSGVINDILKFQETDRLNVFQSRLYSANTLEIFMGDVAIANDIYRKNNMDFIAEWYETFIRGDKQDVDMLQFIVEIPDEDWSRGAKHINGMISGMQAGQRLREATPLAEKLVIDENTGRLSIEPIPMLPADLYKTGLNKLQDQIGYMKSDQNNNFIHAMRPILEKLEITLEKYTNNPQRVHDDQISASRQIKRLVKDGFLPDDHRIMDFSDMLDLNALDIRAAIPEVAMAERRRSDVRFRELDKDDRVKVQDAIRAVVAHSDEKLADELIEDEGETFREDRDQSNVESAYRLTSRLAKVEEILRNVGKIGTTAGNIVTIVATMVNDLSVVFEIAGLLLRLLGLA